jgi:gas vesicle protein
MPKSDEDDSDDEKPDDKDELNVELEIQNSNGKTINKFSSKEYKDFNKYEGGPPSPTALPNKKGLNRFVWNMRHQNMPGIPIAYIEASYRGHKVAPGEYKLILTLGDKTSETMVEIKPNPLYPTTKKQYDQYDQAMSEMEESLTEMHRTTNQLFKVQTQIRNLLETLTKDKDVESLSEINKQGEELVEKLKSWDEDMVQRKSKAYDDVENFPNKFTAEYLMLINQTESDIPRVTQGSIDRRAELDSKWQKLKKQAQALLKTDLPKFNKQLWAKKIGAIWARE